MASEALDLESAPDKPLPRDVARALAAKGFAGRPSKFSPEVAAIIVESVRLGAFLSAAAGKVGVAYQSVRDWIVRGNADSIAELDTPYASFATAIARAQSEHEVDLTATLSAGGAGKYPDWRAQAFVLERRYEHWRLPKEQAGVALTLALTNEQTQALVEALRVATATDVTPDDPSRR